MQWTTIICAICVRVLVALFTRTYFQPDEYFQSLEPAHVLVFGYGHLTWEWLAVHPIRSAVYPALNVPIYWILKVTKLGDIWPSLLIAGPKILHGALAAMTDVWVCELTVRVIGEKYVSTTFFLSLTSFFHALSLSRSLSNSLETSLTTIALAHYPWDSFLPPLSPPLSSSDLTRFKTSLVFVGLACSIRPISAIIWVYMLGTLCWHLRFQSRALVSVVLSIVKIGLLSLLTIFCLDSFYYSKVTFTPLHFLLTNLSSVSLFYGSSPWHYYVSQALPILCTTSLPFILHGAWLAFSNRKTNASDTKLRVLLGCVGWTIGVYSMTGHKEWRFLHPLLPLLHVLSSKSLVDAHDCRLPTRKSTANTGAKPLLPIRTSHLGFILCTVPASVYVVFFHCSAQISVMSYLRSVPSHDLSSVGFLMPCHSTPWQAYLHRPELAVPGRLWALGCEPPLGVQNLSTYKDQTDIFYDSPIEYLQRYFPAQVDTAFPPSPFPSTTPGAVVQVTNGDVGPWKHNWPQLLVIFGILWEDQDVQALLKSRGYNETWRAGWQWEGEGKRKGGVIVLSYSGNH